jgi:hypothetical protein
MPAEIKRESEKRKREELEKLEKAEQEGRSIAVSTPRVSKQGNLPGANPSPDKTDAAGTPTSSDPGGAETNPKPMVTPRVEERPNDRPPAASTPEKQAEPDKPKIEGSKRKGKKGDGDN